MVDRLYEISLTNNRQNKLSLPSDRQFELSFKLNELMLTTVIIGCMSFYLISIQKRAKHCKYGKLIDGMVPSWVCPGELYLLEPLPTYCYLH